MTQTPSAGPSWQDLIGQCASAYSKATASNDWQPPDGDYTAVVEKVLTGIDKNSRPYWILWGRLLDGVMTDPETGESVSLAERAFKMMYLSVDPAKPEAVTNSITKGVITKLAGQDVNDLVLGDAILKRSVGTIVSIKIKRTPSKKGDIYTNCYLTEVHQTSAAPSDSPSSPPVDR
jgi:hypothetical protein